MISLRKILETCLYVSYSFLWYGTNPETSDARLHITLAKLASIECPFTKHISEATFLIKNSFFVTFWVVFEKLIITPTCIIACGCPNTDFLEEWKRKNIQHFPFLEHNSMNLLHMTLARFKYPLIMEEYTLLSKEVEKLNSSINQPFFSVCVNELSLGYFTQETKWNDSMDIYLSMSLRM